MERVDDDLASPAVDNSDRLADHTTLRVGGPANRFVVAETERELIDTVTDCDERGEPVLILGGGSNLLISDDGFPGTVVRVAITGLKADVSSCGGAAVRVGAGENWDTFVAHAVDQEWSGIEMLSGIPGSVGATPIQNVGAYGSEVAHTLTFVRTWDRHDRTQRTFPVSDCGFGYRTSRFKQEPGRYIVLEVGFQFGLGSLGAPIAYPELARHLGTEPGKRVDAHRVREAVLAIRGSKGMVLDEADHDTWSAGSFFTNPILTADDAAGLPAEAPRFAAAEGAVKTSAAWLIQNAGFPKGFGNGAAGLSTKHVLALTNRGAATAADLVNLARTVRDGVEDKFGITLVPEVNLVGISL
ncbi:MAG TPA: UDP-N-acetylmuramate dehydrogenase [Tessaracoccus flavescens]|uniref:UDP-N-acetylenolpyruvoylglucosamine reductase n=1 Tax=Tessaracoccus flavescens TaxID=399497 RepID=A0A921ELX1_9ACTN|nr:UDP-N-acetylmuramate dehydrogenase [Tessaracoccus flavescens]